MKFVSLHLFRGARPKSLQELKDRDIELILDLESGAFESTHDDWYEKTDLIWAAGIVRSKRSLSDFFAPTRGQIAVILLDIRHAVDFGANVLVHCLHGKDRTGFVIAAHRMQHEGWGYWRAVREMFREGFHWFPYIWWLVPLWKWRKK